MIFGGAPCREHSLGPLARCWHLCTSWSCFLWLLPASISLLWMLRETRDPRQSPPAGARLSFPTRPGQAPRSDAPESTTRRGIKASGLSRAALSLPWVSAGTDGAVCSVNSFPLQEVCPRCRGGATLCSKQKAGAGPASWRQRGRKP